MIRRVFMLVAYSDQPHAVPHHICDQLLVLLCILMAA